ncbi:MAG: dCTP deaminase [Patescibacteria group bacterium]|nr:dCTP deaminase [Patescibacteria group bacterium]
MLLVDFQIKKAVEEGKIKIDPYDPKYISPGAYYFRLGSKLLLPKPGQTITFKKKKNPKYDEVDISNDSYVIKPGEFLLGQPLEKITVPNDIGMFVDGRTTMARLGLSIHQTATFVHPGHTDGVVTLEIFNAGNHRIELFCGMDFAKGIFIRASEPAKVGYNECDGSTNSCGGYDGKSTVVGANVVSYVKD